MRPMCWPDDETGVSLIELLVALTVLAIVFAGTTAGMISSLQLTNDSRAATVASGLATASIEEALARDFADLEDEVTTPVADDVQTIDDQQYTISRQVSWVSSSSVTGECTGTASAGDSNVLLIDVTVDWASRTDPAPISQETTVSPPVGLYDPNNGTMAIYVSDAREPSQPVPGVQVTIDGPLGGSSASTDVLTTDEDGCAVFQNIEAGEYDVSIDKANHIDVFQRTAPDVVERVGVGTGSRVTYEFRYAPAGHLEIDVVGREGGQIPAGGFEGFVASTGDTHSIGRFTDDEPTSVALWPDAYQSWVGSCSAADPEGLDDDDNAVWPDGDRGPATRTAATSPGEPVTVTAGSLEITWDASWTAGEEWELAAISQDSCDDTADPRIELGQLEAGVERTFVLPWGTWDVVALDEDGDEVGKAASVGTLDPADPGRVSVVLERDRDLCVIDTPYYRGGDDVADSSDNDGIVSLDPPRRMRSGEVVFVATLGNQAGRWLDHDDRFTRVYRERNGATDTELALWSHRVGPDFQSDPIELRLENRRAHYSAHSFAVGNIGAVRDFAGVTERDRGRRVRIPRVDIEHDASVVLVVGGTFDARNVRRVNVRPGLGQPIAEAGHRGHNLLSTHAVFDDPPRTRRYRLDWIKDSEERLAFTISYDSTCT